MYLTYGRITSIAFALLGLAFVALHGLNEGRLVGWRRAVGRSACATWSLLGLAALLEYYTPFTDQIFVVAALSLLATLILTAVYGFSTAREGRPRPSLLRALAGAAISFVPIVALTGHIPMGALGFGLVWLWAGATSLRQRNSLGPVRQAE